MKIFLLTHSPSPYQVELLDRVAGSPRCELAVCYLLGRDPDRSWVQPRIGHEHYVCSDGPEKEKQSADRLEDSDLAIFNYYNDRFAQRLMGARARSEQPWVFWGERPGARSSSAMARFVRRWRLRELRRSRAPIWGIGRFAVEGYRAELGASRAYVNLPYFSDLARFSARSAEASPPESRVILFSGALVPRKGVDLLARAFVRLAREMPGVRLRLLGEGPLRQSLEQVLEPVTSQVEFLGFKDWAELPRVYALADLLCAPSRYDGWGMIVPEGLAAGLPVIGTNRTGAALEFLKTGRNGWLVSAGDESALYLALREAALLPMARLESMSVAARASVAQHGLEQGALRFLDAAADAVAGWSD